MKTYLVFVTGCTEPSLEKVESHEHALERYCDDCVWGECDRDTDASFVLQIDENGEPNVYPFGAGEVEDRFRELETKS